MIEAPEPPRVEIGDVVKFYDREPVRVVEYTGCDDCFLTKNCNRNAPLCYRVECPSTIAFAEVL